MKSFVRQWKRTHNSIVTKMGTRMAISPSRQSLWNKSKFKLTKPMSYNADTTQPDILDVLLFLVRRALAGWSALTMRPWSRSGDSDTARCCHSALMGGTERAMPCCVPTLAQVLLALLLLELATKRAVLDDVSDAFAELSEQQWGSPDHTFVEEVRNRCGHSIQCPALPQ